MSDNQPVNKKSLVIMICSIIAGLFSLLIFIPQIQDFIILTIEKFSENPISRTSIHLNLIKKEIQFLYCILIFLYVLNFSFGKLESQKGLKILSYFIIILFSLFLILSALQSDDLWLDELFSVGLARHKLKDLISLTAQDVHPPLYYMILKIAMMLFPASVSAAKVVSVIPVIFIFCISNLFFTKEYTAKHAIFFNIFLMSSYSVLTYAVEIRMYSWCLLFCFLCCICSYYIIKDASWKAFLLYITFAEAGAYCQYWTAFGLAFYFILISILIFIKDKKNIKKIIVSILIGIILYIPWLNVCLNQISTVSADYWIGPVSFNGFIYWNKSVIPSTAFLKAFVFVFILYFIFKNILEIKNNSFPTIYSLINLFTPSLIIICATIISLVLRPVFTAKYVFPFSILILFFFVISLFKYISNKKLIRFIVLLGLLFAIKENVILLNSEKESGLENKKYVQIMKDNVTKDTVFLFSKNIDDSIPHCIAYQYPHNKIYNYDIPELFASAYFFDRKNIINNIDDEKDLCLIIPLDEEAPEEFSHLKEYIAKVEIHPEHKIYFLKK